MRKSIVVLMVLTLCGLAAVGAQNIAREPTYGTVELDAGFIPDPFTMDILAGGEEDISWLGYFGNVADAPDLSLFYEAGVLPLTIYVEDAETDTVLLINDPTGEWHYNDDTNGVNPSITFSRPESGRYDIWIGTFFSGSLADSVLAITEIP